ncbi:MAG: hypothetical protein JOS17DRAFT_775056 [Linnemannia elongata]|nr:MAG: hypothetical protein JOS17DRAFT_775056 [Linnemannia elongata]
MPPTTRRGNMFGPYLLLQTLGEGEFAKVKLGMHAETGEESIPDGIRRTRSDTMEKVACLGFSTVHPSWLLLLRDQENTKRDCFPPRSDWTSRMGPPTGLVANERATS